MKHETTARLTGSVQQCCAKLHVSFTGTVCMLVGGMGKGGGHYWHLPYLRHELNLTLVSLMS